MQDSYETIEQQTILCHVKIKQAGASLCFCWHGPATWAFLVHLRACERRCHGSVAPTPLGSPPQLNTVWSGNTSVTQRFLQSYLRATGSAVATSRARGSRNAANFARCIFLNELFWSNLSSCNGWLTWAQRNRSNMKKYKENCVGCFWFPPAVQWSWV